MFFVSVASKGLKYCTSPLFATHTRGQEVLHLRDLRCTKIVHFVARGRWARARTGISCNCTQKLLYQRNMGSSRGKSEAVVWVGWSDQFRVNRANCGLRR